MKRLVAWLRRLGWRIPAGVGLALIAVSGIWWLPAALSHLAYFQVRHVEIDGRVYTQPSDIVARMRVDTTMSVWMHLAPIERRVASDPQVRAVHIERKLPGTLVVRLEENLPVALVPGGAGGDMRVVDAMGHVLPIPAARADIDLPVVDRADPVLLAMLADVRAHDARLFDRISWAEHVSGGGARAGELALELPPILVRASAGLTAARLADIVPVEADLARRHARVAELDLRFRDQVIARLQ